MSIRFCFVDIFKIASVLQLQIHLHGLIFIIVVVLSVCSINTAASSNPDNELYRAALSNNKLMLLLYDEHMGTQSAVNGEPFLQNRLRFKLFRNSIQEVLKINSKQNSYKADVNFMSYLSAGERLQYTGLNVSDIATRQSTNDKVVSGGDVQEEVDWVGAGYVTFVSDQGMCGSCWTFAGVGPVEGRYALKTGTLNKYSEQEALECVYDKDEKNGCRGGQYFHQWDWIKKNQHQSLFRDYPYKGVIFSCRSRWYQNHFSHAKLTGFIRPAPNYRDLAAALNTGPLAVGIKVAKELYLYKSGIFAKEDCGTPANHAVVAVGYTSHYFKLKNSWGQRWGDNGFVKFSRAMDNMCDISLWAAYPTIERTDDAPDVSSDECSDKRKDCKEMSEHCGNGEMWKIMATGCAKTCGICGCRNAMLGCGEWARNGYCTKPNYAEYMKLHCPLSCRSCAIHPTFDEKEDCIDTSDKCDYYKSSGYCTKFPEFVSTRCRKTCNLCTDGVECEGSGLVFCDGECRHEHMC